MKKTVILVVAALLVVSSLVGGVFALYQTDLDEMNGGTAVAKQFVLTGETSDGFTADVKIAPTEFVEKSFSVANYDAAYTTETAMDVTVTLNFTSEIEPLTIALYEGGEIRIASTKTATSTYTFRIEAGVKTDKTFTVKLFWESSDGDNAFIGRTAGFTVNVSAIQA